MRIHRTMPRPRIAFLFEARSSLHVPSRCDWADVERVEVAAGEWKDACRRLSAEVDATVAFDPGSAAPALRAAPGLRLALVMDPGRGAPVVAARASGDIDAFTWPERWRGGAPVPFQALPPPLDEVRLGGRPRFERGELLVAQWAPPPPEVRARLGARARVLPASSTLEDVAAAAEHASAMVWCSGGGEIPADPRFLVALARGLLVVTDAPPPADWALDPGDDVVVCASAEIPDVVSRVAADPTAFAPVRVRAWQRIRESFSSAAVERFIADVRARREALEEAVR
jgi:hypothetical protein